MITPAELTDLQRSLRDILPDPDKGVIAVLDALKKALPEQTEKYNAVFQLETRFNAVNKDRIGGLLAQADLELAYNRITADLLDLIDGLLPTDFDANTANSSVEDKSGSILYRIPHTMEVEEEHKCIVRLAFDMDTVVKNIELTTDTEVKDLRVSEVMEVELLDPNESPCFSIRKLNSVEQFLEKNDYTEWIFYVKPLIIGNLPLVLKVSVKELINDKERIKEIVLEEVITVIAEPTPEGERSTFKSSGYAFSYGNAPGGPPPSGISKSKIAPLLILGLAIASGVIAAVAMWMGWIPTPDWLGGKKPGDDDRIFWQKTLQNPTRSSLQTYILAYPDGLFTEEARFKIDSLKLLEILPNQQVDMDPPSVYADEDSVKIKAPEKGAPPKSEKKSKKKDKPKQPEGKNQIISPPVPEPVTPILNKPVAPPSAPEPGKKRKSGFEMVSIPGGSLSIDKGDCPGGTNVKIIAFKIGRYEVTQADWWNVMGQDPSFHSGCSECPVEKVSWNEVQQFLQKASQKYGKHYRLPFEAEWEFAARGGTQNKGYKYAGGNDPNNVAWFNIIQEKTHEVGTKRANELGIFDLSGNVWEWCQATYPPYLNCKPFDSDKKILRGGSWADNRSDVKISARRREKAQNTDRRSGFRIVEE